MRRDLGAAAGPDGLLDPLGQDRELVLGYRAALAGPPHPVGDLLPVERLGDAAPLAHHQDHGLLGGEPAAAAGAGPAPADGSAIIRGPAVDDPAIGIAAVGAEHRTHLPGRSNPEKHNL